VVVWVLSEEETKAARRGWTGDDVDGCAYSGEVEARLRRWAGGGRGG